MNKIVLVVVFIFFYVQSWAQPANDDPCGAITIPIENTGCEPTTVFSWTGATFSSA